MTPRVIAARALGIRDGCLEGEPARGVMLAPVLILLAELFIEAVLLTAEPETTLEALRARLDVALLFTFAFGRKVGDGAEEYDLNGDGERET